jgi:hypothetical protein
VIFGLTKISSLSNKCDLLLLRWGPVNLEIHLEGIIIFPYLVTEVKRRAGDGFPKPRLRDIAKNDVDGFKSPRRFVLLTRIAENPPSLTVTSRPRPPQHHYSITIDTRLLE